MHINQLHHGHGEEGDPAHYIIKELKLDEQQQQQFAELRNQHHHMIQKIQEEDKQLHDLYFSMLKTDNPDKSKVDSIATLIGDQRKIMAQITFDHFHQLRNICHDDQKKLFDNTINRILDMMVRQNGDGPPH